MDHFNATIKDGKLVNTRRGLQVSRQKFNGLSFVNSCPQDDTPDSPSSAAPDPSRPPQRLVKFVDRGSEPRQGSSKAPKQDVERVEFTFASDVIQQKKPRRKATPRDQLLTTTSSPSSQRSSRASSHASSPGDGTLHQPTVLKSRDISPAEHTAGGALSSPSAWQTNDAPAYLTEENWKLFNRYFAHIPPKLYPYEDILTYNPARGADFYNMMVNDSAALHCVLMSGTIAEAVVNMETDPKGFAYHISKICAILNQKLNQKQAVDPVTLHCIATLASMGCYVGRLDHWHMHMRGLQKVLDVNGGLDGLPPALLAKIHKADLKGAAALASTPYLPFTRKYGPISTVISADITARTSSSLSTLMGRLHINTAVIDALTLLSLLGSSISLARQSAGSVAFDPHAFTEEYLAVMHALVTQPGPLRDGSIAPFTSNPYPNMPDTTSNNSGAVTRTENYMANHRLQHSVAITPAGLSPAGPVEPALRIVGLLFLKELLPDWPRNLGGYAVLLSLLRGHICELMHSYTAGRAIEEHSSRDNDYHTFVGGGPASRGGLAEGGMEIDPDLLDPLLQSDKRHKGGIKGRQQGHHPSKQHDAGLTMTAEQNKLDLDADERERGPLAATDAAELKSLIIWLCLIGNLVSLIADENECRQADVERYPRGVYRDCLRQVLVLDAASDDIDALFDALTHNDLVMLRLFDVRSIRGDGWDDKAALKALFVEEF
ncbi:hypothetical protein B0T26DRAFT_327166 [Lasiosphaeria miniovina]|uniref:Uncharacterized protein n=1 Tax=Lasiosphaeria miniovina TaxID=1954250 RepID=A0AA40AMA8_9PEZI|nr:uncharacterized protein B0T26DRAFT_327166 [Lasiosphaeria miniovina]KAK0718347.1 hypothetical protein B0T26DRAFT_327166 [Lasiosphaeria miniovina]